VEEEMLMLTMLTTSVLTLTTAAVHSSTLTTLPSIGSAARSHTAHTMDRHVNTIADIIRYPSMMMPRSGSRNACSFCP
jgi:hypothetical protein